MSDFAKRLKLDLSKRIGELSKGNRQKVAVIQAFMHEPKIILLDEPTSGLDPLVQLEFEKINLNNADEEDFQKLLFLNEFEIIVVSRFSLFLYDTWI